MSKCNNCNAPISFMSVLNTPNPFKIKCSTCKEAIHIDKKSGGIAVLVILALLIPTLVTFYGTANYWVQVVFPVVAAAEVGYFILLKKCIVKLKNKPIKRD